MKKVTFIASILAVIFCGSQAIGQITNEVLVDWTGREGPPKFYGITTDENNSTFTVLAQLLPDYTGGMELITFDKNRKVIATVPDLQLGGLMLFAHNNNHYIIHPSVGLGQGHQSALSLTVVNSMGQVANRSIGEPGDRFLGFYKGVSAFHAFNQLHFYTDSNKTSVASLNNFHSWFGPSCLFDSTRVFTISQDSAYMVHNSGLVKAHPFPYSEAVKSTKRTTWGTVLLNAGDTVFEVDSTLQVLRTHQVDILSGKELDNIFLGKDYIYAIVRGKVPDTSGAAYYLGLAAFDRSFDLKWETDLRGRKLSPEQIVELNDHIMLSGTQGAYGFVKSFHKSTGKMTHPDASAFKVLDFRADRAIKGVNSKGIIEVEVENVGADTIESLHFYWSSTWGNRSVYGDYSRISGVSIAPGEIEWINVGEVGFMEYHESYFVLEGGKLGMPNDRISATGTQYVNGKRWWLGDGDLPVPNLQIQFTKGQFRISGSDSMGDNHIQITDLNGRIVNTFNNVVSGSFQLANGAYLFLYQDGDYYEVRKFVVN